ncbi:ATP-dependent helicase [Brevibacterium sp. p3-SID960]|uniref:ATP-dependent helicase n=1 Tax=Brevibacterium sp. p3-SID960 TaxID=2916063 RepID=UPI0021A60BD2|nr:ATP-dependent DNA helicase [Brevibacterium sp. p3-SID960]MCT1690589.1 ATP-dependent helicase [Brevibacterium sp. p3-SID960]
MSAQYSAAALAEIVGVHPPTDEQAAIIEAELEPTVIIAGAGSGKTETLALRVLWLIANGYADPQRILGLTFTRKAVGELTERIWAFVRTFRRVRPAASGTGGGQRGRLADLEMPTISTYNSYAASLVSDYGLAIGIESDSSVLDAAGSIQLAEQIILAAEPHEIPADVARTALIGRVREMAGQINEHLQTPQRVLDYLDDCIDHLLGEAGLTWYATKIRRGRSLRKEEKDGVIAELRALADEAGVGRAGKGHTDRRARDELAERIIELCGTTALEKLLDKRKITVLAERFLAAKRQSSAMEFSDQVKYAYDIMSRPDGRILSVERSRWDAIMLDEYQDTSDSQFQLLQRLFNGKNVMAVGDPRQSIYAWRGASARNISDFPKQFQRQLPTTGPGEQPRVADAHVRTLSIGWRNDKSILAVANRISEDLPEYDAKDVLRPRPGAGDGRALVVSTIGEIDQVYGTDLMAELVDFMHSATETWHASGRTDPPQRAVLCRKRSFLTETATALENAGFEVHVAGADGLLEDTYVADIHAALHTVTDPNAGTELMRLISGRSCSLGAADIAALHRFAKARNDRAQQVFEASQSAAGAETGSAETGDSVAGGAGVVTVGIIEAVDDLIAVASFLDGSDRPQRSPVVADWRRSKLSETATRRLIRLAESLRRLRRLAVTVPGLVRAAIVELDIDTEVASLPEAARANHEKSVDAFISLTGDFVSQNPVGSLDDFLTWLAVMDAEQSLSIPEEPAAEGAITIMTVHGSKGLGFDIVAIPHLTVGDMPTTLRSHQAWLTGGMLPYALRGDRHHIPRFDLTDTRFATEDDIETYRDTELKDQLNLHHAIEERRIGYVAVTRAKQQLWLGGSLFTTRQKENEFSPFLHEAAEVLDLDPDEVLNPGDDDTERPEGEAISVEWPKRTDPAEAARRAELTGVFASALRAKPELQQLADAQPDMHDGAAAEIAALAQMALALQAERAQQAEESPLPSRLSATGLVQLAEDPRRYRRELRRPMPQGPSHAAGLGTAFHAWVENFYGQAALSDLDDDPNTVTLPAYLHEQLDELCRRFERSRFAALEPAAVEQSFELTLTGADGHTVTVPGKIDAIFAIDGGYYVVDWKTGRSPRSEDELADRAIQLAIYRMAVQKMPAFAAAERIECGFYFLGDDQEITVPHIMSASELVARLGL